MIKLTKKEARMILRPVKEKHQKVAYLLSRMENEKLKKTYTKEEKEWRELLKKIEDELHW